MAKRTGAVRPPDGNEISTFLIFIVPSALGANYLASGQTGKAAVAFFAMPVLYLVFFAIEQSLHRISYYRWMVVGTIPYQVAAIAFLVASSVGLYRYFDNGITLKLPGDRIASGGSHVLLCILGLIAAAAMLRVVYNKLVRFSFQKKIEKDLASICLIYDGQSNGEMLQKLGDEASRESQVHSLTVSATVSPFVHSLAAHFIAVERLREGQEKSGVVWTSNRLGLLSRMAVVHQDNGKEGLVNLNRKIDRLTLQNGTQLRLEIESTDPTFFEPNSEFQVVIYLTHGGYLLKRVTIPTTQATAP